MLAWIGLCGFGKVAEPRKILNQHDGSMREVAGNAWRGSHDGVKMSVGGRLKHVREACDHLAQRFGDVRLAHHLLGEVFVCIIDCPVTPTQSPHDRKRDQLGIVNMDEGGSKDPKSPPHVYRSEHHARETVGPPREGADLDSIHELVSVRYCNEADIDARFGERCALLPHNAIVSRTVSRRDMRDSVWGGALMMNSSRCR